MRNVMQETDVKDWKNRLAAYIPRTSEEAACQQILLSAAETDGNQILSRSRTEGHITCSGFVMNPSLDAVLMAYHLIYDSFAWTGGHADGSNDFLATAIREVKEETGVTKPYPLTGEILSMDMLPVKTHQKNGITIPNHLHYNITYGVIASPKETLHIQPFENKAVRWIPVTELPQACQEPHMLPIYEKLIRRMQDCVRRQSEVMQAMTMPLFAWYPAHARKLPWRQDQQPYHVWISEIMLQQTRVEAVIGYYQRFLQRFPNVTALAEASQDEVNKCWEGLGYYSRAANLKKAAQVIVTQHGGVFPKTWEEIRALPGVGDYTAGAICSICYGLPTPAVDGNVLRVVSRVTDHFCEIDRPERKAQVTQQLSGIYSSGTAGTMTQALMELGETVCLPHGQPLCGECPLADICMGRKNNDVMRLPQRTAKKPRRKETYTVFLLCYDGKIAVRKRETAGLLHGLWEFPNIPGICTAEEAIAQVSAWGCQPLDLLRSVEKQHIFTHVEWLLYGVYLRCACPNEEFVWKTPAEIAAEISLPTAFRQFELPERFV